MIQAGLFGILFAFAAAASADPCRLEVSTPKPVLPVDAKQTVCVKVGVTGFEMESDAKRKPLNTAIVLDRSGSMSGESIERAKEAACAAVELMKSDDIVAVIAYDSDVETIVPATKLGDKDKQEILAKIKKIESGGTTALYEGTRRGGEEVKKFLDKEKINRVILLSDGLANVGPSSPAEAGELGKKLGGKGICVTTLGLGDGYNEDLMLKLSQSSDGNHVYITKASNLVEVFDEEFQTATKVVAQEISCRLICEKGVKPLRILNREGKIDGQTVSFDWNQIYAGHERYVLIEVEVPAGEDGEEKKIATARVSYANMQTNATDELSGTLSIKYSSDEKKITESINKKVMEEYALQTANLENIEAMKLRDSGDVEGARQRLKRNQMFLKKTADELGGSEFLQDEINKNRQQADVIGDDGAWSSNRKIMRAEQSAPAMQQLNAPVK